MFACFVCLVFLVVSVIVGFIVCVLVVFRFVLCVLWVVICLGLCCCVLGLGGLNID